MPVKRKSAASGGYMQGAYTQANLDRFNDTYLVQSSGIAGVTRDASGKYVPASAAEWTLLMAAAGLATGNPASLWLCQDASGNLLDSIGAVPLVPNGAGIAYNAAVAGWSRTAAHVPAVTNGRFVAGAGAGVNISTSSALWLGYVQAVAQAGTAGMMTAGGAAAASSVDAVLVTSTRVPRVAVAAVAVDGAQLPSGTARPWVLRYDRTNSRVGLYTDQEKVIGTYSAATTDGNKGFGASTTAGVANQANVLYGACFSGAAAELSDAQIKTLLQTLGWTIPWS